MVPGVPVPEFPHAVSAVTKARIRIFFIVALVFRLKPEATRFLSGDEFLP